jgi:tRNA A-37 threonylcarbamoyl transferase component Bud32
MTASGLHQDIETALLSSRARILRLMAGPDPIWVKRPRRGPGYTVYALQYGAAELLGIGLFRPPKVSRGAQGLVAEARRLACLRGKGWPVPHVLDITPHWLAISDNGTALGDVLRGLETPERSRMLRGALEFVQALHAEQGWHGAAQIRNLTYRDDGFGAIDFEDDLEPSMPLELRQARDLYLFLVSAARYAKNDAALVPLLVEDALRRASGKVAAEVRLVGAKLVQAQRLLGWIAPHLGRDGPALSEIAFAFQRL